MQKPVLFIARDESIMTHRRYILIANRLADQNIRCAFITVNQQAKTDLYNVFNDIPLKSHTDVFDYDDFKKKSDFLPISFTKTSPSMDSYEKPNQNNLSALLKTIRFNPNRILFKQVIKHFFFYHKLLKTSGRIIQTIRPFCVFYDIEVVDRVLSILDICRNCGIKIISLQHAEGFGRLYVNLPRFADYYIAYSEYNVENIRQLGIKEKDIWLVGSLENEIEDVFPKSRKDKDEDHVLVALKPNTETLYKNANFYLVATLFKIVQSDNKLKIKIKLHPSDWDHMFEDRLKYLLKQSCFDIIDRHKPLIQCLNENTLFISFESFALIEAAIKGANVICIRIEEEDRDIYPSWDRFALMNIVNLSDIQSKLARLLRDPLPQKQNNNNREQFIKYFRPLKDNRATFRIASNIVNLYQMESN